MWTIFGDMYSGGSRKHEKYEKFCIEAPLEKSRQIMWDRFDIDVDDVTCKCCGDDFCIDEVDDLDSEFLGEHTLVLRKEEL